MHHLVSIAHDTPGQSRTLLSYVSSSDASPFCLHETKQRIPTRRRARCSPPRRRTPGALPHLDSCLFSPTLSTDLIEGNHSDKKPPTMMPPHSGLCVLPPSNPAASPPLQLLSTPIKMPCRSLDPSRTPPLPVTTPPFPSHRLQHRCCHNEPFCLAARGGDGGGGG